MEFYDFPSSYDCGRRQGFTGLPQEFFRYAKRELRRQKMANQQWGVELDRFRAEEAWLRLGCPYFKVWPGVIPLLANVGLDVPPTYLRLPFPAFVLRLPKDDSLLKIDESHQVRTIMVVDGESEGSQRVVMLWLDVGECGPTNWPQLHWSRLICRANQTIEEAFDGKAMPNLPGISIPTNLNATCLRLAVSVVFLSTVWIV